MQMPLFKPQTEWLPPEEFPDLHALLESAYPQDREIIPFPFQIWIEYLDSQFLVLNIATTPV